MDVKKATPLSEVRIYANVPLSNDYKKTITFANRDKQLEYFAKKQIKIFGNLIPVKDNIVRLPVSAQALDNANYLSFISAFDVDGNIQQTKRYYAFITKVDFVNINCCEITFEVDVIQSNIFDWILPKSYIARQHSNSDKVGDNIEPEPFTFDESDYWYRFFDKIDELEEMGILLVWNDGSHDKGYGASRVFSGNNWRIFPDTIEGRVELTELLDGLGDNIDYVTNITMIPMFGYSSMTNYGYSGLSVQKNINIIEELKNPIIDYKTNSYVAKNNKVFTYPFNMLAVTNNAGTEHDFKCEFFTEDVFAKFQASWAISQDVCVNLLPLNYQEQKSSAMPCLQITSYPKCAWNNLAYLAWSSMLAGDLFSIGVGAVTAVATTNPLAISATIGGLASFQHDYSHPPIKSVGSASNCSTTFFLNRTFSFHQKMLNRKKMEQLDLFFTQYGYACNRYGDVLINGRNVVNYVETRDMAVAGNIPRDDKIKINAIFNQGVFFYHNERGFDTTSDIVNNFIVA